LELYSSGSGHGRGHGTECLDVTVRRDLIAFLCVKIYTRQTGQICLKSGIWFTVENKMSV
jgi:hypothetical protein